MLASLSFIVAKSLRQEFLPTEDQGGFIIAIQAPAGSSLTYTDSKIRLVARLNRERSITVFANVKQGESQKKALDYVQTLSTKILPSGYHVIFSGSSQTFQESFSSLIFALIFGIFVAYMVLAT